jgi:flagellar biosynthetic protein FliP
VNTPVAPGRRLGPAVRFVILAAFAVVLAAAIVLLSATAGWAATDDPAAPGGPAGPSEPDPGGFTVEINGPDGEPSTAIVTLIGITLLSVAPALLLMMTSFTKIFVVLTMTRNALSLPSIPPTQVLAGLSLFLSIFIMAPVLMRVNELGVQPYLDGQLSFTEAVTAGTEPLRTWMLGLTRQEDIALITRAAGLENPVTPSSVDMVTLIPAFILSELRAAFIITSLISSYTSG